MLVSQIQVFLYFLVHEIIIPVTRKDGIQFRFMYFPVKCGRIAPGKEAEDSGRSLRPSPESSAGNARD